MTPYQRIFGTGPRGIAISTVLLGITWQVDQIVDLPPISGNGTVRIVSLVVGCLGALLIAGAATVALPPKARGTSLVTTGIYRHVRHPIYASLVSSFNFGLAIYLDGWLYLAWAVLLHPLWHWNVGGEERMMAAHFPEYPAYTKKTGRFLPGLFRDQRRPNDSE